MIKDINRIKSEADELIESASIAVVKSEEISEIQSMPEVSHAIYRIIETYSQNPCKMASCVFLLGVYMGLEYNKMKIFTNIERKE